MTSLLELTASRPTRTLAPGDILVEEGERGGDLYILLSGQLSVVRDGVRIASISQPGALVGEMSVLLGTRNTATVSAERNATVRVVQNARHILETEPGLGMRIAAMVAGRLDATSALLVEMARQSKGAEQPIFRRILSALHMPARDPADG